MLRSFLIYLSKATWAQKLVTSWGFAWRMASRFVAGEKLEDAIIAVQGLNAKGINATLDHLGEHTTTVQEAERAADDIIKMLERIQETGVHANVSIKLTQIGMGMEDDVCRRNLFRILEVARQYHNFVRIDMEDTPYTDKTLALLEAARAAGYDANTVGTVLQSYLFRSLDDEKRLAAEGTKLRLVKGAYKEPPDLAFPKKRDVDANFDRMTAVALDATRVHEDSAATNGRIPPLAALGTHDPQRIDFAKAYAAKSNLPKSAVEIQMLYGIRRDLQDALTKEGYPVRIYVPFGKRWYPYFMRRLAERPANIWFFISNFFRR